MKVLVNVSNLLNGNTYNPFWLFDDVLQGCYAKMKRVEDGDIFQMGR